MEEKVKFKKGDILMVKREKRERYPLYPRVQPMLVVDDTIQWEDGAMLISVVSFGMTGNLLHYFHNADHLEYCEEEKNVHYRLLECISEGIMGRVSIDERNIKLAEILTETIDDKLLSLGLWEKNL